MEFQPDPGESSLEAFLKEFSRDRDAGRDLPLADYLMRFPGDDVAIARAFANLSLDFPAGQGDDLATEPVTSLARGDRFGHYHILDQIGRGGQGIVYEAEDSRLRRKVALKILRHGGPKSEALVNRFKKEAEVAARLEHPGICIVHDAGIISGTPYISMQLVAGETLAKMISTARIRGESGGSSYVSLASTVTGDATEVHTSEDSTGSDSHPPDREGVMQVVHVIEKAARALHAAHEARITHRDIKPGNIMVRPDGQPVILDFGMAHVEEANADQMTQTGDFFGTPPYMSPEQLTSNRIRLDRRTDIYSLGVTLFECLTLARPFEGTTRTKLYEEILTRPTPDASSLNGAISSDLEIVIKTAMEKARDDRFQTALDFADDLGRVRKGEPIKARPIGPLGRMLSWSRRNRALATVGTIAIVLLIASPTTLWLVEKKRGLEIAKEKAHSEREARKASIFSLLVGARALVTEVSDLHPAKPETLPRLETWVRRADSMLAIDATLTSASDEFLRAELPGASPGRLAASRSALVEAHTEILKRITLARSLPELVRTHEALWRSACDDARKPPDAVDLSPQTGLVPFRRDPTSGLWEFWHVGSGEIPDIDPGVKTCKPASSWPILLVLVPGGGFRMGLPPEKAPVTDEKPALKTVPPFFVSKYEVTQAQFARVMGSNPSWFSPSNQTEHTVTGLHPVETVTWHEARTCAHRLGLRLPSEVEWEYCARAKTENRYVHGDTAMKLEGFANVMDQAYDRTFETSFGIKFDDGHAIHAPVGTFKPNDFGLHDMVGNVTEWCATRYFQSLDDVPVGALPYDELPSVRVLARGSHWRLSHVYCYIALRIARAPAASGPGFGFRLALSINR